MHRDESGNRKTYAKLNNRGFSLIEVLVTLAILGVVGGLLVGFLQAGTESYQKTDKEVDMQYDAQVLLNQIGDYVINANAGFEYKNSVLYIYSQNGSALETEEISFNSSKKMLYYTKKQMVNGTTTTITAKTEIAQNVSAFTVDLQEVEEKQKVKAELTLQKDEKNYQAKATWNVRNPEIYQGSTDENEEEIYDSWKYVEEVQVSAIRTMLRPGEEQLFYAKVIGSYNPSQKVSWYLEGDTTSEDTFVDDAGVLHIGADEKGAELTVFARSVLDPTKTGSLKVTISNSGIRIAPEQVWLGVTGGSQDPDSRGVGEVELTAELSAVNQEELSELIWTCSREAHDEKLADQANDLKKTLQLSTTEAKGSMWVQAAAEDGAGNTILSNQAEIHVVTITSSTKSLLANMNETQNPAKPLYIYGLEDVAAEDVQIASSFEQIKENTLDCRFYIYDSKEALVLKNLSKMSNGSFRVYAAFHPKFNIWDWIFPDANNMSTCIGVYEAGKLNTKVDADGATSHYGFSVYKMGLTK